MKEKCYKKNMVFPKIGTTHERITNGKIVDAAGGRKADAIGKCSVIHYLFISSQR